MLLDVWNKAWERHRRKEKIRRQMNMTKRCSREMDILLGLIGIDFSGLEICPVPVENEE